MRYARSEELSVLRWLRDRFDHWEFVSDRQVQGGCSRYRPDILIDFSTHSVVVEVDEHQHQSSSYSCDNRRRMALFQDLGMRPLVFMRFNPHIYTSLDGTKHRTCWTKTPKTGEPHVPVARKGEWVARLETLAGRLQYWGGLADFPTKEIEQEFLFYDGYERTSLD